MEPYSAPLQLAFCLYQSRPTNYQVERSDGNLDPGAQKMGFGEQRRPQETRAGKNFLPAHLGSACQSQTKPNHPPKERMESFASKVIIAFQLLIQRTSQHRPMLPGKFPEVWTNLKSVPLSPLPLPVLPFPCRLNSSSQHLTLIPLGSLHRGV